MIFRIRRIVPPAVSPAYPSKQGCSAAGGPSRISPSRPANVGARSLRVTIETRRGEPVPTGRVKWYDPDKGFGFLSQEDGEDVYIRSSALPDGVEALKAGQRVEFGVASGRRGPQALSLKLIDPPPSPLRTRRESGPPDHKHTPDELHGMVEDMITLLESAVQPELRKGRYPDRKTARRVSEVVKGVARELDA